MCVCVCARARARARACVSCVSFVFTFARILSRCPSRTLVRGQVALKERDPEAAEAKPAKSKDKEELELDGGELDKNKGITNKEVRALFVIL